MFVFRRFFIAFIVLAATAARAQFLIENTAAPGQTYLVVGGLTNLPCFGDASRFCVQTQGINVNQFVSASDFNSRFDAMNGQISRAFELTAVAAALKDAIPNPGDRFAIRVNAAAFSGQAAGAIGFSYNLTDSARVSVNYGQGRSQGIISGGMNFSFR